MQTQIKKVLQEIISSFESDSLDYLTCFKKSLQQILISLKQEQQIMKEMHQQEIDRLKDIIRQKQQQIRQLKQQNQKKYEIQTNKQTPYKILLKSNKNQDIINNKENVQKQDTNNAQYPFCNVSITAIKQNRYSLQVGPSGFSNSGKRTCRINSSHIKNKIINQQRLKFVNSPREWNNENNQMSSKYLKPTQSTLHLNISDVNLGSPRFNTTRNQKQEKTNYLQVNYDKFVNQNQIKSSSITNKPKLCRKPNNINRSKRGLFQRKKEPAAFETNKFKGVQMAIPIKIINVSDIKPR